jgi:hypothetical protein
MTLSDYLNQHFETQTVFAERCDLHESRLADWISAGCCPQPSYVASNEQLHSHVFGGMPAPGAPDGKYHHPAMRAWVERAKPYIAQLANLDAAALALRQQFSLQISGLLLAYNSHTWRLRDSFDDAGAPIEVGLRERIDRYVEHLRLGTFGLCVHDAVDAEAIVNKEILQEKLSALSDGGERRQYSPAEAEALLKLIDDYQRASMPFSPVEYSRSSRKRLVDDLRPIVMGCLQRS